MNYTHAHNQPCNTHTHTHTHIYIYIYIYTQLDEPDMQDTAGEAEMNS